MKKNKVSIVEYENPIESVANSVELCGGNIMLSKASKVFIKPNVVFWTRHTPFPKYGVITTSRVVKDMVVLLKDLGVTDITIGEGGVTQKIGDRKTFAHAFETLGYKALEKQYGVNVIDVMEEPFVKTNLGDGITLNFNRQALESDLIISLPAMKSHNQTVVSLGIKNLKGLIDIKSRKKCHNPDPLKDLHFHVSKLADPFKNVFTLIDGIFSLERGPGVDGKMHRRNTLIASTNALAADKIGATVLGFFPSDIPYIKHACATHHFPDDLSDVELTGIPLDQAVNAHAHDFIFLEDKEKVLPLPMAKQGMKGLFYRKYDTTMCTYCSGINGVVLSAINAAWDKSDFDQVEVLTGKKMVPAPNMKTTILLGKCMYQANKNNPDIQNMIAVKGCPPKPDDIVKAFEKAGVPLAKELFEHIDMLPGSFMDKVKGRPEFDESFFKVADNG